MDGHKIGNPGTAPEEVLKIRAEGIRQELEQPGQLARYLEPPITPPAWLSIYSFTAPYSPVFHLL